MKLSILVYNIYFGFRNPDTHEIDEARLKAAKRIVKKYDPDVLVLTEAGYGAPNDTGEVLDYKKEFGYEHAAYASHKPGLGVLVLSKLSLTASLPVAGPLGSMMHTVIDKKPYPEIIGMHPWFDLTDEEKIAFFEQIMPRIEAPAIICGDFNSLSHNDEYDRETMLKSFERFAGPDYEQLVDRLLEREFLRHLEETGFVDAFAGNPEPTIPTDWADEEKLSPLRMDFILTTPDIEVEKAEVITGKDAEQASDHYPLYAELRID